MRRSAKGNDGLGTPYRRSDGRWVVPRRLAAGTWKPITIPLREQVRTEREALDWAAGAVLQRRIDGTLVKPRAVDDGPILKAHFEEWLKLREVDDDVSGATYDANKSHLKVHIEKEFGTAPVRSFNDTKTQARLAEWIRSLKASKGANGKQTVKNVVATFRTYCDWAMSPEGGSLLATNPLRAQWIMKILPKRKRTDSRFATIDDAPLKPSAIQAVLDQPKVPLQWRARIALVFTSPMRDGEIAGLRLADVFLDAEVPYVDIAKACVLNHKKGFAKIGVVKKEWSNRKLPLHPAALAGLREWIDEGWEEFVGRPPSPEDPLFPRDDGEHARPDSAEAFRAALRAAGQLDEVGDTKLHFHDARGCVATWMKNAHVSDSLIRRMLGHAPVGAAEEKYFKGHLLEALVEAQAKIPLTWPN
ncbi:MAG: tyrosine-type recombinase/integrase [Polyangiales bacterium]